MLSSPSVGTAAPSTSLRSHCCILNRLCWITSSLQGKERLLENKYVCRIYESCHWMLHATMCVLYHAFTWKLQSVPFSLWLCIVIYQVYGMLAEIWYIPQDQFLYVHTAWKWLSCIYVRLPVLYFPVIPLLQILISCRLHLSCTQTAGFCETRILNFCIVLHPHFSVKWVLGSSRQYGQMFC